MKFHTLLIALLLPMTVSASCINFPRDLKVGMRGDDVYALQKILNSDSSTVIAASDAGSPGNESDYFGPKTFLAVQAFQRLYGSELLQGGASSTPTGIADLPTRTKLGRLSCEIDVSRPSEATSTSSALGSGECAAIPLAPLPRPKVRLDEPIIYRVHRGDVISLYGANFTDNNTVDIGNKSLCAQQSADGGSRIDIVIPSDLGLGVQYVRVTDKYGVSNIIKLFILEASSRSAWTSGCVNITRTLTMGSKGDDVQLLQRFLNSDSRTQVTGDGVESYGNETNVFSLLTKNGVRAFQRLYAADVLRPAKIAAPTGIFGPLTAKKVRALTNCGDQSITASAPTLMRISPTRAAEGDDIVLTGSNFMAENSVLFGADAHGPYVSRDGKSLVVTLTSGMKPGVTGVAVKNVNGKSNVVNFTVLATSTVGKVPYITSISPTHAKAGTTITLTGVGFTALDNTVSDIFGGVPPFTGVTSSVGGTKLSITIPTATKAGVLNFQVVNADGKSNTRSFIVDEAKVVASPYIDQLDQASIKQGASLGVTGKNFFDPLTAYIDGAVAAFRSGGSSRLWLLIPVDMSLGTHQIYVKNVGGESNRKTITVIDKNADDPYLTSVSPARAAFGDTITLTGRNLSGTNIVYLGADIVGTASGDTSGTKAVFQIRSMLVGDFMLHVENRMRKSNEVPFSLYVDERPAITTLSPVNVYPGDSLRIYGKNLGGGKVVIGTKILNAVNDYVSNTQLSTGVPADMLEGNYEVLVRTEKGDSNTLSLHVLPQKTPKLTSVAPGTANMGTTIYLSGEALGDVADVHIGGTLVSGVQVRSSVSMSVDLPTAVTVGSYQVWVTTKNGDTNKLSLTVRDGGGGDTGGTGTLLKPIIYSLSPSEITRDKCLSSGGLQFTIRGENFSTTSVNLVKTGIGGEHREVSSDGRTLHFQAGGSAQDALPCITPTLNPFDSLDIYVYVQNQWGTSEGKIFKLKPVDPLGIF